MNQLRILRLIVALLLGAVSVFGAENHAPSEVLIRFKDTTTVAQRTEFEREEQLVFLSEISSIKVRLYRLPTALAVADAVARYNRHAWIEFAEPNHTRSLSSATDPSYPVQWALDNRAQRVNGRIGPSDIDINWPEAMARFRGTTNVVVAVVDSGVALDHPEFRSNAWVNTAEALGSTGTDDDLNGYIDDSLGWDFFAGNPLSLDQNGHGTLVASVIAGGRNNGLGGTGICPAAKIMSLRVLDQFARGGVPKFARVSDVALALDYAQRNGAKIVNLSLSGSAPSSTELFILRRVSDAGVLVVAASGNGGTDRVGDDNDAAPVYPASYNVGNMIAVAAVERSGGLTRFSNRGATSVHIAAPGTDIYGANVTRRTVFSENFQGAFPGWLSGSLSGNQSPHRWTPTTIPNGNTLLTDRTFGVSSTYAANSNTWVRSPAISLSGVVGARLEFESLYDLADDYLFVEASADGVTWETYDYFYGTSDQTSFVKQVDLSDLDGRNCYLRFALFSNASSQGLGVFIDDVKVSGVTLFDAGTPRFQYLDGTSFAAPIVAGVAALVMSQRPDLTMSQVRAIVLGSARTSSLLNGRVATGGMVDAHRALEFADNFYPPRVTTQPQSRTINAGLPVSFSASATSFFGSTYQWFKNGTAIPGATTANLTFANVQPADAGSYVVRATNPAGSATSIAAILAVNHSRLVNVSVRATAGTGTQTLIVGFNIGGGGTKQILLRGIGPTLGSFGVTGALADPQLRLFNSANLQTHFNDDWGGWPTLTAAFGGSGAFNLPSNSRDAALLVPLAAGSYSAQIAASMGTGVALVEGYDADAGFPGTRLSNLSVRSVAGTGANVLTVGFVIAGNASKTLLIRGIGPTLVNFGVTGTLADPQLRLFNSSGVAIDQNDNWGGSPTLANAFSSVAAFALPSASRDAALLVALAPGSYTAQISGVGGTTGVALVEVYEVPVP